jgi:hypothetical protein
VSLLEAADQKHEWRKLDQKIEYESVKHLHEQVDPKQF